MTPKVDQTPSTPEEGSPDDRLARDDELPPDLRAMLRASEAQIISLLPDEVKRACVEAGLQLDRSKGQPFTIVELRRMCRLSEEYYDRERNRAAAEALADERTGGVND